MKNNEKVWPEDFDPTTAGPRTWTHPPGVLQRGTTTGKHNGETKGEQTGIMKNGKMKKSYL